MISPKEILKGCVVSYEGQPRIVKGVMDYIILEGTKEWIGGSLMNGEPISGFWLEKFGFEWDQMTYSKGRVWLAPGNCGFDVWVHGLHVGITRHIEYVHELQVLYFAVTSEHLQVPKIPKK